MTPRLANLAPLAGDSDATELHFVTNPDGIVKICDADPGRWAVIVTSNQAGLNLVTSRPDFDVRYGIGVPHDGPLNLTYAVYLSLVQKDLYYVTDNPFHDIEVVLIRINARG